MKASIAHVQQQLPMKLIESRQARLQRLLSGDLGKVLKPASAFTFTSAAAKRAQALARKGSN